MFWMDMTPHQEDSHAIKLGFTFTIFFAACTCQEINPDAAQTSAAQTSAAQTAAVISGTVLQADLRTPLKNAQVTATRGARPEHSDEVEDAPRRSGNSAQNG